GPASGASCIVVYALRFRRTFMHSVGSRGFCKNAGTFSYVVSVPPIVSDATIRSKAERSVTLANQRRIMVTVLSPQVNACALTGEKYIGDDKIEVVSNARAFIYQSGCAFFSIRGHNDRFGRGGSNDLFEHQFHAHIIFD